MAIRQMDALARIMESTADPARREVLLRQAGMILRSAEEAIPEPQDRALVAARHAGVLLAAGLAAQAPST